MLRFLSTTRTIWKTVFRFYNVAQVSNWSAEDKIIDLLGGY